MTRPVTVPTTAVELYARDTGGGLTALRIGTSGTGLLVTARTAVPADVYALASANVSVLTPLLPLTLMGDAYSALLFSVINLDASVSVDVYIDTSPDGVYIDGDKQQMFTVAAGKAGSMEIGPGIMRRYWRLAAASAGPTYPTVNIKWEVRGVPR